MNTVQLVQTQTVPSTKIIKLLCTFPRLGYRLRENFRPTRPGLPHRAVTLVQITDFIHCFCLSSRRPAGIDCSGLASQARESEFEAGRFAGAARPSHPQTLPPAAMSEAYFPVESGALGPEENFLSLDDILMSQEKLPVRVEKPMPRLGAFFLERGAGADSDQTLPQVSRAGEAAGTRGSCPALGLVSRHHRVYF